ncbi:UDP-glucose--hexose-1-phosphate uridylyltransferase [Paucisalibacillus globulus]|uniref:UDP-glucose--hexose-1-phosphate uridylyltransferase n=1 Tax=Paucisalibacillus globulus TaxID=351095 RepID=UPI000407403A|nr:UDP-glucose--hexose-1-phosphate uridylyltransferase [Paucisalibacillus globulus]
MIYQDMEQLIHQAKEEGLIDEMDKVYCRNRIMSLLEIVDYPDISVPPTRETIPDILERIILCAIEKGIIQDVFDDKEILSATIMDCLMPRPSEVNRSFYEKYKESPKAATDYFYRLSKGSNYIQMNQIKKNISFKTETTYGLMDITINLSKPEKDPEQIKREKAMKHSGLTYPKCLLCIENEGYSGRTGHPARANHRIIKVPLGKENWYLQYSPFVYYNEHCIILSENHRDMKIDRLSFERLLAFTDQFPHYFVGSNADLPIVGGSILSHDHYQGGRYEFAMMKAEDAFTFDLPAFPMMEASVLKWPMSVIRLQGSNADSMIEAADFILNKWKNYSDEAANIVAYSQDTPHNTITPIARKQNGKFELNLVLRNNRTSDEHPLGIFHPHADVHHIKKENIGLIEVMGLAVFPPRLKNELEEIKNFILNQPSHIEDYHLEWATEIKERYPSITHAIEAEEIIQQELGKKFVRILEDAGVFKDVDSFMRFINELVVN